MRALGIRHYLVMLVLAAFLPVAALALVLFFLSMRGEYETAWQRAEARTTFIAAAVQTQTDALVGTLDALSASRSLADGDFAAFHAEARAITGERVDAVSLVRPDGVTILNSRVAPGHPTPAFSVPADAIARAVAEHRLVVTSLFSGATSRRPIFGIIKPVRIGDQPYALAVGLFASRFEPLIDRTLPPWTAALLDDRGKTAARFPHEGAIGDFEQGEMALALATADRGRLTVTANDGSEHLLVFERVPVSRWVVACTLPRSAVEGPAQRTAALYAVGVLVLCIPSLALAIWLGWRLVASMQGLARFAAAMGQEAPPAEAKLPPTGHSCRELEVVADRLESAATGIAARDTQLRQQRDIAERNAERIARQSEELARSNTELEQFAYVASHDLREPLRMVSSFLTLLERHLAAHMDAEAREYVDFARNGALRMDQMILDLLQYSRVGRVETAVESVDLNRVVKQALDELAAKVNESGGQVVVLGALPTVPGYPGELARLFQNLIGNALKYRDADRPPLVEIACHDTADGFEITIADNGIGIDPQFHQRIFAIFQRLHTRQRYEGNGIGLAICKKVVEHHGGRIWVESQPGAGTIFHFTLSAALRPAPAVEMSA